MSIADRITSMSNNLSSAYDGIEYLGVDTTGVDKNLQNLSSMLNVVYEGLPKVSDEGINPSIEGSRVGRLKSTLKASDTTQESTTGKNLWGGKELSYYQYGVNFINNKDGSVTAKGTAAQNAVSGNVSTFVNAGYYKKIPAGTYTASKDSGNIQLQIYDTAATLIANAITTSTKVTFTLEEETDVIVRIMVPSGTQINETVHIQLEQGSTNTEIEPYTGGIPSPNPDYSQDIHVVKGNNIVEVCGNNLCSATMNVNLVSGSEKWARLPLTYENSNVVWENGATYYIRVFMEAQSNEVAQITNYGYARCDDATKVITFEGTIPTIRVGANTLQGDVTNEEVKIMVAKVSFDTYEPYNGTTYPINLPVQNLFDKDNADVKNWIIGNTNHNIDTSSVNERSIVVPIKPNTTYTISKIFTNRFRIGESSQYPQAGDILNNYVRDEDGNTSITITTLSTTNYLVINIVNVSNTAYNLQDTLDSIQIELGDKPNRYTPYGVAPIELCKISTYQDKLFKAISGDTVYDSLTAEQKEGLISGGWYKYGEAGNTLLNGSETYNFTQAQPSDTTLKSITTKISDILSSGSGLTLMPVLTSHFTYAGTHGIITSASTEECFRVTGQTEKRLGFITKQLTIEDFKTWLSTHNTTVYYVLATPTITQITDTTLIFQLEALYSAMSKNGQTNVLQTNADNPFTIFASALKGE